MIVLGGAEVVMLGSIPVLDPPVEDPVSDPITRRKSPPDKSSLYPSCLWAPFFVWDEVSVGSPRARVKPPR